MSLKKREIEFVFEDLVFPLRILLLAFCGMLDFKAGLLDGREQSLPR
jgi:hypothetical protein